MDALRAEWIARQSKKREKRFPKPHKPKPREEDFTRVQFKYDMPSEWAEEFDEYITDAVQMFIDYKTQ